MNRAVATDELKAKLKTQKNMKAKMLAENNKWLISCKNKYRNMWDYVIILIAIYSVVVVPIRIGINPVILDPAYIYIDIFTWILYVLDVIINLRTTYIDNFGEEVKDNTKITLHYVKTYGFWVDLISLVAFPGV